MNGLVNINNQELAIKEYQGKRVVTFKDIDMVHGRPKGTASRNFRTNRDYFVEGEDYYRITPDEFRRTIGSMDKRQVNAVTLITETGYLMLIKSFTDKLAWEVQRKLVNSYFRLAEIPTESAKRESVKILKTKYLHGIPVMTYEDLTRLFETDKAVLRHYVKKHTIPSTLLEGRTLAVFKRDNPIVSKHINRLVVFRRESVVEFAIKTNNVGLPEIPMYFGSTKQAKTALVEQEQVFEEHKTTDDDVYKKAETVLQTLPYLHKKFAQYLAEKVVMMVLDKNVTSNFEFDLKMANFQKVLEELPKGRLSVEYDRVKKSKEFKQLAPASQQHLDNIYQEALLERMTQ